MNRRGFLKAVFAGTATSLVPATAILLVAPELFRLHGDGYHDDTRALQALINGEVVIGPSGERLKREGNTVYLPRGTFALGPGAVRLKPGVVMQGCAA